MNTTSKTQRFYFAHSKILYGTTREAQELEFLRKEFPHRTIICPFNNLPEFQNFNQYLRFVDLCFGVVVSEIDGHIGRGVFAETARALSNDANIYVLRSKNDEFYLSEVIGIEIVNQNDWKIKYGRLITKQ